jgi:hypothetical protein
VASTVLLALALGRRASQTPAARRELAGLGLFAVTAFLATHAMTLRHADLHYLLPAGVMQLLLLAAVARGSPWLQPQVAQLAVLGFVGLLLAKAMLADVQEHRTLVDEQTALHEELREVVDRHLAGYAERVVVYGWRIPEPSFALREAATSPRFLNAVAARWPREGAYVPWSRELMLPPGCARWDCLIIREQDVEQFPEPLGREVGRVGEYCVFAAPRTG